MRIPATLIAAPVLCLAALAGAAAQSPGGAVMPNTAAPGAAAPARPGADTADSRTPTPQATDRRGYAEMLGRAANAVREAIPRIEAGGAAPAQAGATSPAMQALMQAMSEARHVVERAPADFTGNDTYRAAVRDMRDRYGDVTTRNPRQPEALEAARGMVGTLDRLREAALAG